MILVTGGTGYIGSVTVAMLRRQGEEVVVLDDCARGHAAALPKDVPLVRGKVGDRALLAALLQRHRIDACIHFAGLAYVGESVEKPGLYFQNNVVEGLALVDGLLAAGVDQLVFSSSCATYGQPEVLPIAETEPQRPISRPRTIGPRLPAPRPGPSRAWCTRGCRLMPGGYY